MKGIFIQIDKIGLDFFLMLERRRKKKEESEEKNEIK